MNYKKIIILGGVAVIAGLVFFVYVNKGGEVVAPAVAESQLQAQVADLIKTKDFSQCEKVSDKIYKSVCINNIALNLAQETKDITYCQKLDNELVSRASCEQGVLLPKSIEKEDINVCKEMSNQEFQKQCESSFYISLANKKQDILVCNRSTDKKQCEDGYYVGQLNKDSKLVNCKVFSSKDLVSDCEAVFKDPPQKPILNDTSYSQCRGLKTNVFLSICMMKITTP